MVGSIGATPTDKAPPGLSGAPPVWWLGRRGAALWGVGGLFLLSYKYLVDQTKRSARRRQPAIKM